MLLLIIIVNASSAIENKDIFNQVKVSKAEILGKELLTIKGDKNDVKSIIYSPDGKYILSVATNNEITYIYDSFNLKYITQLIGADFEYSLDSRYVLNFNFISIVGSTEKASVYTANDWVKIGTISGNAFEFSPNSKYIFSAFVDYNGVTSYVYDINNCKPLIKMTDTYIETIDKYILSSYNDQTYVVYIDN